MKLDEILLNVEYDILNGSIDEDISDLVVDSRKANDGSLFICISGALNDGHKFAKDVIEKGVSALVIEKDLDLSLDELKDVTLIKVNDTRLAMAYISANYFKNPANDLKIVAITGTKGKTTSSYMVKNALELCGFKVGLIGTIETIIGEKHIKAKNTTPDSFELHRLFEEMKEAGIKIVVMEVSSQALMLNRTAGINFDIGVFTNLAKDHIGENEHSSFENYLYCKSLLFKQCKLGIANIDDSYFDQIFKSSTCEVKTFGLSDASNYKASNIKLIKSNGNIGVSFDVECSDALNKSRIHIVSNIPGRFSVYNLLCAISICKQFGASDETIKTALIDIKVKGRVELKKISDKFTLMIDYAHNAMALESLLETIKEYKPKRLVTLFGCGGDRSKDRRFEMGEVSGRLSDLTIITSDNPRTEDPQAIIDDIVVGISKTDGKYIKIIDRREAIKYAIDNAKEGDVIILAGKGHEDYQEINGKKYDMDERVIIDDICASYC